MSHCTSGLSSMELHTTTTTNTTTPSSALKNSSPHTVHVVIFSGRHTPSSLCLCAAFPPPHHCHIHPTPPPTPMCVYAVNSLSFLPFVLVKSFQSRHALRARGWNAVSGLRFAALLPPPFPIAHTLTALPPPTLTFVLQSEG